MVSLTLNPTLWSIRNSSTCLFWYLCWPGLIFEDPKYFCIKNTTINLRFLIVATICHERRYLSHYFKLSRVSLQPYRQSISFLCLSFFLSLVLCVLLCLLISLFIYLSALNLSISDSISLSTYVAHSMYPSIYLDLAVPLSLSSSVALFLCL